MGSEETDPHYLRYCAPDGWGSDASFWSIERLEAKVAEHTVGRMVGNDPKYAAYRLAVWIARLEECQRLKALTTPR
jgi:hypothetical protein